MEKSEMIEKAKQANSPEELLVLARENDYPLDEEGAGELFERLHSSGEISDEELDNVSGGGCGDYFHVCPRCEYPLEKCDQGWRCRACGYTSGS
ncbi:MAG: hypothetical protein HFH72_00650 [Lachnospiraceae bacterium]|nr:hypothetical protein [Lachnospiraceae bacterium]